MTRALSSRQVEAWRPHGEQSESPHFGLLKPFWRDGDNLVIDANEYPSVVGPFLKRRSPGVVLRQARDTGPDRYAECIDARTRVIGVSYVSYLTGERHDLSALRALADSVGALLVVVFTQAAGYLPIEASVAGFRVLGMLQVAPRRHGR